MRGVVQLVRTPACHAGGRGFESRRSRQHFKPKDEKSSCLSKRCSQAARRKSEGSPGADPFSVTPSSMYLRPFRSRVCDRCAFQKTDLSDQRRSHTAGPRLHLHPSGPQQRCRKDAYRPGPTMASRKLAENTALRHCCGWSRSLATGRHQNID
jgi:hypothetical protein